VCDNYGGDEDEESPLPGTRVLTFPSSRNSTQSSLTTATTAVNEEEGRNAGNRKCLLKLQSDESPSPVRQRKNPLPNFDAHPSDDDSVILGDKSDGWEVEEDRIAHYFVDQARKEDQLDIAAMVDYPPVAEVDEWMELAGDSLNDDAAAAAMGGGPRYDTVKVSFVSSRLKSLKAIAMELKLSGTLTKRLLFNRIRDSGRVNVAKLGDDEFELRRMVDPAGKKKETWMVLTPEVVPPIPGVNLATGAQVGFYGPTNRENAVGGARSNLLTKEKIVRPCFVKKGAKKKSRPTNTPSQGSPWLRA
jgi:hypothetical protein